MNVGICMKSIALSAPLFSFCTPSSIIFISKKNAFFPFFREKEEEEISSRKNTDFDVIKEDIRLQGGGTRVIQKALFFSLVLPLLLFPLLLPLLLLLLLLFLKASYREDHRGCCWISSVFEWQKLILSVTSPYSVFSEVCNSGVALILLTLLFFSPFYRPILFPYSTFIFPLPSIIIFFLFSCCFFLFYCYYLVRFCFGLTILWILAGRVQYLRSTRYLLLFFSFFLWFCFVLFLFLWLGSYCCRGNPWASERDFCFALFMEGCWN